MSDSSKAVRIGIEGVFYSLTHVPDLVRYGSKPSREIRSNPQLGEALGKRLRSFTEATAYAPHQVYIGNITPQELNGLPKPWYEKLIEGVRPQGRLGDLVAEEQFYSALAASDQFELVTLDERWFQDCGVKRSGGRAPRVRSSAEVPALCDKGAFPLYSGRRLAGAFEPAPAEDATLT